MAFAKDEWGVQRDDDGNVTAVKLDKHVLDPESPEAVQVPADTVPDGKNSISDAFEDVETEDL